MGQILVRRLDDDVIERLRVSASQQDLPLESYIREILVNAARAPTPAERLEAIKRLEGLWAKQGAVSDDSVPLLRQLREGENDRR